MIKTVRVTSMTRRMANNYLSGVVVIAWLCTTGIHRSDITRRLIGHYQVEHLMPNSPFNLCRRYHLLSGLVEQPLIRRSSS